MQTDNKHTDKKLQELENQSLPDLSKMDEHWRQMKPLLQPAASSPRARVRFNKNYFRGIIAAIFISGLFVLAYKLFHQTNPANIIDKKLAQEPVTTSKNLADTVPGARLVNGKDTIPLKKKHQEKTPQTIMLRAKTSNGRDTLILGTPVHEKKIAPKQDNKASLDLFFKQLEKQTQEFVINSKRDTLLSGHDGTVLLIPAHTFNGKDEIMISMKEFYSYEDIISNQLTTCSDGKQLVTGGMLHIVATANGKEVSIQPGKAIRWFVPDTSAALNGMQLFTGASGKKNDRRLAINEGYLEDNKDTLSVFNGLGGINWLPQEQYFSNTYLVTSLKVLDLKNEPFKTRQTSKGEIGFFHISNSPKMNREELEEVLKEKYGYYKVKIKTHKKNNFVNKITRSLLKPKAPLSYGDVGDSAWIAADIAKRYGLKATDTVTYLQASISYKNGSVVKRTFSGINRNGLARRFSVDIRTLGWINCDKFYRDSRPKIDYYVDLKDTAANYYTLLVFNNIKSMMTGYTLDNKIVFPNVPSGESATLITVGIQNGKTVSAMEKVQLSKTILTNLKFEDTSPMEFENELKGFDK